MLSLLVAIGIALAVVAIPGIPTAIICLVVPRGDEDEN